MKDGFLKVAVSTPELSVADCEWNKNQMVKKAEEMAAKGAALVAFPEFSLTGYTCGDLFLQDSLVRGAENALASYRDETEKLDLVSIVGLPIDHKGRLYNVAAVLCRGQILGLVPKTHIPNYSEFYEARQFSCGPKEVIEHCFSWGETVPFGRDFCFAMIYIVILLLALKSVRICGLRHRRQQNLPWRELIFWLICLPVMN